MDLKFLVVEGNAREGRESYRAGFGKTAGEAYAETLATLAPDASCEILCAADAGAAPSAPLDAYDAAFITGSALNLYDGGPEIERQVALARAIYAARIPFFGSCWGLQVACAAAGGTVLKNPRGREIGVARNITPTGKAVTTLCSLAARGFTRPSAAISTSSSFRPARPCSPPMPWRPCRRRKSPCRRRVLGRAVPPGVFFRRGRGHRRAPRRRAGPRGFRRRGRPRPRAARLRRRPAPGAAWRLGLSASVLTREARALELTNFIEARVRPEASARGRA